MGEYRVIGSRVPRMDAREKVSGRAVYTSDISLPNMLYGKVLRSPYPHARILSINTSRVRRLTGVKAVVTGADTPKIRCGISIKDEPILCFDSKVRYMGEPVAAVAATDEYLAEEALDLIRVEYEEIPAVFNVSEAMLPSAPQVHEEISEAKNNTGFEASFEQGNVENGFQEADVIVEETFMMPPVNPAYLETISCVASFDISGKLTVWTGAMWNHLVREQISSYLRIPVGKIRVVQPFIGSCFGAKNTALPAHYIAVLLARKAGRAVRLVETRIEDFLTARQRGVTSLEVRMGAKRDGTITAEHRKAVIDCGAYVFYQPMSSVSLGTRGDLTLRLKNTRYDVKVVYTNKCPSGPDRSFANLEGTFPRESMLDMLSEKLGMDTVEFRLKNCARRGEVSPHGWPLNSCGLTECIEKAVVSSGWKEKKAEKRPGIGIGIASMGHESDMRHQPGFGGTVIFVKLLEDGRVQLLTGENEYGQGAHTCFAMTVAEELGIPVENVEVMIPDSDVVPYALGPLGSKLTITGVTATRLAALDAKKQVLDLASQMLAVKVEDLEMKEGTIHFRGMPEQMVLLADVAREAIYRRGGSMIIGKGVDERDTEFAQSDANPTKYGASSSAPYFDTVVAEVAVDTETGEIQVLKVTVADDCGKVVNLLGIEGQVQGATVAGLGTALIEETLFEEGRLLSSFRDYTVPGALNIPPIDMLWVESIEPSSAYGCKGGGQSAGMHSVVAAIANAIYDAVGVRINRLPITSDKILRALEERDS